jgi:hypothetical protein
MRLTTLLTILFCAVTPASAATPSEFYLSLLHRGVAAFETERYSDATGHLKLAAFGLMDSIENYQTAQVYLTLSYDKLNDPVKARDAARRVVLAEHIQRKFATIRLPDNVAKSFDGAVTKLLGNGEAAYLRGPAQNAEPSVPQPGPKQQAAPGPAAAAQSSQPPREVKKSPVKKTPDSPEADPPKKPLVEKPVATAPRGGAQETSSRSVSASQPIVPPPGLAPAPSPAQPAPLLAKEAAARLSAGERALSTGQLTEARRTYRSLLDAVGVARDTLIRVAEGLYRARDFDGTLAAFAKAGSLRRGEEPYHYYLAVAYYETGQYARAKAELAAAIPFIEVTPDVARYRVKIDESVN